MRAARIIQEDPNPRSLESLTDTLRQRSLPVTPIQDASDTAMLKALRKSQAKFDEKARLKALSREARLLKEYEPGTVKLKIIKPRAQLIGAEKRVQEAYTDFAIEVPVGTKGRRLKELILRKQEALLLPELPVHDARLFVNDISGRQTSAFIGREILDKRGIDEYDISEGQAYDVVVWQTQQRVSGRYDATLLMVDARPGVLLPQQIAYVNVCRTSETPCYTVS